MAQFKNDKGEVIDRYDVGKKRVIFVEGVKYKRIPKPKYRSRATRCSDVASSISSIVDSLRDDDEPDLSNSLKSLDWQELEDVRDEYQEWRDNLPESLADGEKSCQLDDVIAELENAISTLESVSDEDEVESVLDQLDDAVGTIENAEYPTMYG